ncbi:MAG: hypothetical protein PHW60_12815 [Kiritimatiellae bacterium]|nr:hypothetical protein [Kiritimatiellia bacterium]
MSFDTFPMVSDADKESNPAIQLFGKRLFNDQSPIEFLVELLLIVTSSKRIGRATTDFTTPLPSPKDLSKWQVTEELMYSPKARLNLKLFAFIGASRLDSRHQTHREHYKDMVQGLRDKIRVAEAGGENDVLRTLQNLFLGFQGAGFGRTWCAQSFMPVCKGLLAGETIWNETAARREPPSDWDDVLSRLQIYFTMNKHRFLARGGEVLYLQMCIALKQKAKEIREWAESSGICLEPKEADPVYLHEELQRELDNLMGHCPQTVTDIAEFLDSGVESETSRTTDYTGTDPRLVAAGYCPADTWREGYLFAVDLLRLCQADLDVIERLQLLETACAMQVLRNLAAQSIRHCPTEHQTTWPGYRLAVSAPDERNSAVKRISRHTAKMVEKLIYRAIRCDDVELPTDQAEREKILKEADKRYAGKLFVGLAKRIGLLVPRRGAGVRFTLNEQLLRLLVVTTVPIGGRLTYDRFKELVEARHGLVFDGDGFTRASSWVDGSDQPVVGSGIDTWLQDMLDAAGLLIHLSDSCALVVNPAAKKGVES